MFVDASTVGNGEVIEADVCIAGGGVAGLVTALELESAGVQVALVEPAEQPAEGEVDGAYPVLGSTRAGGMGGTAARWEAELAPGRLGARYAPLAPIDFEAREGMPWSGWPFDRSHLEPFYARAQELCRTGPFDHPVGTRNGAVADTAFDHGPRSVFTHDLPERVARSSSIRAFLGGRAAGVERTDGAISLLRVALAPDRAFRLRSRAYVLALGGIETPRFLLLAGLGNEHDLVGRFFMDHPTARCRLDPSPHAHERLRLYDIRPQNGHVFLAALSLAEETLRREGLLNSGFFIAPSLDRELAARASARKLAAAARRRRLPGEPVRELANVARGLGGLAAAAHRRVVRSVPALAPTTRVAARSALLNTLGVGDVSGWSRLRRPPASFDAFHVIEQGPEPERRVELGSSRDELGRPVARLRWFIAQRELDSLERTEELVRTALADGGVGTLTTARDLVRGRDLAETLHPTAHHHLGTTRMDPDPRRGVVDADGRVHGLSNLYVAGGSVFPTSGFANPTLTIVALASRLAGHLREELKR